LDQDLHEYINILKHSKFEIDLGMKFDIQAFFEDEENVLHYILNTDNNKYFLRVELIESTLMEKKLFVNSFINYIQYGYLNTCCTERNESEWIVKFYTVGKNQTGAIFEIEVC
jgi:hypothetical protein